MESQHHPNPAADARQIAPGVADILGALNLTGGIFVEARLSAPWSLSTRMQPETMNLPIGRESRLIAFHYVVSGRMSVGLAGQDAIKLEAGDIILLPHNDLHVLGSGGGLTPVSAAGLLAPNPRGGLLQMDHGGGGEETRLICGFVTADANFDALFNALPPALMLSLSETPSGAWIAESFAFAARNATTMSVDVTKLAELMLAQIVRRHLETSARRLWDGWPACATRRWERR